MTNNGTGLKAIDITGALTLQNGSSITNLSGNGETVESGASLTLSDTSFIKNGTLDNLGTVFVEASAGAALHGVIVDNTGAIHVDMSGSVPATLILDSGTKVSGGTIDIGDVGTLEVGLGGATLSGVLVAVTVDGGGTGVVQVDDGQIMTLTGTTIDGGTINDLGTIDVTGIPAGYDQGAQLNGGAVTADAKLTLDGVTVRGTTSPTMAAVETDGTVKLTGGATIQGGPGDHQQRHAGDRRCGEPAERHAGERQDAAGRCAGTLTVSGTELQGGTITDDGTIDVTGASKIDGGATLTGGGVTVDANLTLDNVTVSGTKVTIDSLIGDSVIIGETVQLEGGATLAGLSPYAGKITNNGTLEIVDTASLLNDTVSNGSAL